MELNHDQLLGQEIAFEQLGRYFYDTVRSQMGAVNGAALYAFLLEVLDEAGLNADLTVPEFMAWAQRVFRERFPQAKPMAVEAV